VNLFQRNQKVKIKRQNLYTAGGTHGQNCCGNHSKTDQNLTIDDTKENVTTIIREITDDTPQDNRVSNESGESENPFESTSNQKNVRINKQVNTREVIDNSGSSDENVKKTFSGDTMRAMFGPGISGEYFEADVPVTGSFHMKSSKWRKLCMTQ
jgi:hypothetical protein